MLSFLSFVSLFYFYFYYFNPVSSIEKRINFSRYRNLFKKLIFSPVFLYAPFYLYIFYTRTSLQYVLSYKITKSSEKIEVEVHNHFDLMYYASILLKTSNSRGNWNRNWLHNNAYMRCPFYKQRLTCNLVSHSRTLGRRNIIPNWNILASIGERVNLDN